MLLIFVPSPLFRSKMCSILGRIIHGIGIEMRKSGKKTNMDFMSYNHYKYVSNWCPNQLHLKFIIEISLTLLVKRWYIQRRLMTLGCLNKFRKAKKQNISEIKKKS